MTAIAAELTGATLLKIVLGSLAAGLGVTLAFSALIYSVDRAAELYRSDRSGAAGAFAATGAVFLVICLAVVAYGIYLVASKK